MSWVSKSMKKFANVVTFGGVSGLEHIWDDFTGKSAIDKQNEYNMKMWQMQNEYNTPANQIARYREAGLNPNLIYGNGSSSAGNASSAPEMTAHQGSAKRFLDLAQFVLQLKNMKAQNTNLNAQTGNINAQTAQHWADVEYKTALIDFYQKHGYFPNQMNSPVNVARELINNSPVRTVTEGVGRWLGDVAGTAVGNFTSDKNYSGRAMEKAIKSADRKKLNGSARSDYIKNFLAVYNLYH